MFNPLQFLGIHNYLWIILAIAVIIAFHKRRLIKERYIAWRESRSASQVNFLPLPDEDIESSAGSSAGSWISDIREGLSSKTFDLFTDNLSKNDLRKGLDEESKKEVLKIMHEQGLSFDEARLLYLRKKMGENNIGEDGIPMDPKFVRFG